MSVGASTEFNRQFQEQMALHALSQKVHADCSACPKSKVQKDRNPLNDSIHYVVNCTAKSCSKANNVAVSPNRINGLRIDSIIFDEADSFAPEDQIDVDDLIPEEPDRPSVAGAGAW